LRKEGGGFHAIPAIVKASKNSEGRNLPRPGLIDAMTKYNEELDKAGVRVMAKGLHPISDGVRISFPKPEEEPVITEGPFAETNELIAGVILIDVKSKEEAIEWAPADAGPAGIWGRAN
jgi:hypothetical protein